MFSRYFDVVIFKAYADLRSERERTYLGILWWVIEPMLFVAVLWVVFDGVLDTGGQGYVPFVAVGLVAWQWFKSSVSHGAGSIYDSTYLLREVPLPPIVMTLVSIATDLTKFLPVVVLSIIIFSIWGNAATPALLGLPLVMLTQLAMICAMTVWVAALVPFLPDLRLVTETLLMALMFLSGVFYDGARLAEPIRTYFYYNPIAFVLDQWREILMKGSAPDFAGLAAWLIASIVLFSAGAYATNRLRRLYPKLLP